MKTKNPITEQELLDFGFVKSNQVDNVIYPYLMNLGENTDNGDRMDLAVSVEFGNPVLVVCMPDGDLILGGIETIEELRIVKKAITEYAPHM